MTIAIVGLALGWIVDRKQRTSIIGEWYYPHEQVSVMGYNSTFEFKTDGTFAKTQNSRGLVSIFEGEYSFDENDQLALEVTRITTKTVLEEMLDHKPEIQSLGVVYSLKYAINRNGNLVLGARDWVIGKTDIGIQFESYVRR